MDSNSKILHRLRQRSPAGFAIALHIQFTTPKYLLQAYEKDWLNHYSSKGLVMHDPTVHWGFENTGAIRWSAIAENDPMSVLDQAAQYGLHYGLTVSIFSENSRSIASFARADREMSELDIAAITTDVKALHALSLSAQTFTPELHLTLKQLSIYLTHA